MPQQQPVRLFGRQRSVHAILGGGKGTIFLFVFTYTSILFWALTTYKSQLLMYKTNGNTVCINDGY